MKARILLAVAAFVGATAFAPVPFTKEKKDKKVELKNEEAMQGLWVVKSRTRPGGLVMKVLPTQQYVRIEKNTWTFLRDDGAGGMVNGISYTIKLDPNQKPAWLDLERPLPAAFGKAGGAIRPLPKGLAGPYMVGLVEMNGDTMRFVYALRSDRPAGIQPNGPRDILLTLERVKKP